VIRIALGGLGVVLIAGVSVAAVSRPAAAAAYLSLAAFTWMLVMDTLRRVCVSVGGGANSLGVATQLTLLRGLLVSLVGGFALVAPDGVVLWVPAVLYSAAALTDRLDGIVARRLGQVTSLGVQLDGAMDAIGLVAAPLVAVIWRRLPPWYLMVGAAYYVYVAGIWWRRRRGLPVYPERVRPKPATRFFAGAQMVLVCIALPPVLDPAFLAAAATALMIPTLVLFARDWLIVIGWRPEPGARAALR